MKKWFCALGMMLALLMSVALADGVKVTFAEKNGQINGGYDYTLKLNGVARKRQRPDGFPDLRRLGRRVFRGHPGRAEEYHADRSDAGGGGTRQGRF